MSKTKKKGFKRKRKLIDRVQLKIGLAFVFTACILVLVHTIVMSFLLLHTSSNMSSGGRELQAEIPTILASSTLIQFALLLPVLLVVGVLMTFRIVGPIYRFKMYLRQLMAGEVSTPCKIREGDELQDFCDLLNEATKPLRKETPAETREPEHASQHTATL